MKADALVGYAWCRSSYTAIRSLSRLGLRVAVADNTRLGMGQCSRHAAAHYVHANPRTHPEKFIADITQILKECKAHFYLPGHDEGEIVARHRARLPKEVIVPLADYDTLVLANDKMKSARLASDLDVPVPRIISYQDLSELEKTLTHFNKPVVIKLRRGSGAKGTFYAHSSEEAVSLTNRLIKQYGLLPKRYPLIQERVQGEGWGVSCLYWNGEQIASFTHRRLREKPVTGGTSTLRESAHNPSMEAHAHKLLDHLHWHGLVMVEFKWDQVKKQPLFIEFNPRLWGSIALAVACGVDFPVMTYIAATKGMEEACKLYHDYSDAIVARWYLGDLILSVSLLAKRHPVAALRLLLPGKEDIYDDLLRDDIGATIGEFVCYLLRFLQQRSVNPLNSGTLG